MSTFHQEIIDKHRRSFDANKKPDHLIGAYLAALDSDKDGDTVAELFQGKNPDRQMQQILGDMFSAGVETVKTTMEWAMVFMLHHPHVAKGVQDEMDRLIGRARMPQLSDEKALPFTRATIMEIQRKATILPLGVSHSTTRDVPLNGFIIPAGADIIPLINVIHMDKDLWGDPEVFRPGFLTTAGNLSKPLKYFMPFGVGRRMCLGDELANKEIFLMFTNILHTFEISIPLEETRLPNLRGNFAITLKPDLCKIRFIKRG